MKRFGIGLALVLAGAFMAVGIVNTIPNLALFGSEGETRNTQVIESIVREEQVVLLSLGIQGISEKNDKTTFLGLDIPGSKRASFVQYTFTAKLGIDGADVKITQTGEDSYLVIIPEFIFIGHDNETFKLAAEKNGAISFVTPEIDPVEVINTLLSDDAKDEYLDANAVTLQDQAQVFYESIITSIDPELSVRFEFRQGPR